MTPATTTTVREHDGVSASRARQRTPDVNRWIAMLDAELREDESPTNVGSTAVEVIVEFGRTIRGPDEAPLQPGDSVRLDQFADEPLQLLASGRPIARGELVVVDGHWGLRIVELLMLCLAWLAIEHSQCRADERPNGLPNSVLFDSEPAELLETPFGPARQKRANQPMTQWSDDAHSNTAPSPVDKLRDETPDTSATRLTPRSTKPNHDGAAVNQRGWTATIWPALLVVGLIAAGAKWLRMRSPESPKGLPTEAFEVLGRKSVDARTTVLLVRSGSKLLLLSLSPHGLQTLTEVADPVEVDCLAGLCRATKRDQPLAETFRSLLRKPVGRNSATAESNEAPAPRPLEGRFAARIMPAHVASIPLPEAQP